VLNTRHAIIKAKLSLKTKLKFVGQGES